MVLRFYRYRFTFEAMDELYFPPGKAGNIVRGAFGTLFRKIACVPGCEDVAQCEIRGECPYARVFEPQPLEGAGLSGYRDRPRPFVLRASHLGSWKMRRGDSFYFDLHLFDVKTPVLPFFVLTFVRLVEEGMGPGRGRARLLDVRQLDWVGHGEVVFDGEAFRLREACGPLEIILDSEVSSTRKVRVDFRTPTEIAGARPGEAPAFGALFARIRDRISALSTFYGDGELEMPFRELGERARAVRLLDADVRHETVSRRSSRTLERHSIGGFVGEATYEGDLGEFLPFLKAGEWVGVGKHTVWGNGEISVETVGDNRR